MNVNNASSLLSSINLIPTDLFSSREIFNSVISESWYCLSESKKQDIFAKHLSSDLDPPDKQETIRLLLNNDLTKFDNNPMDSIYSQLKIYRLSPDLMKILEEVNQMKRKAHNIAEQRHQCKLLKEVALKRKILLEEACVSSPDGIRPYRCIEAESKSYKSYRSRQKQLNLRRKVMKRYDQEMKSLFSDEKERETSDEESDNIDAEDKLFPLYSASLNSPNKGYHKNSGNYFISHDDYIHMIRKHRRKRKILSENNILDPAMDTSSISLSDIVNRVSHESDDEANEKLSNCAESKVIFCHVSKNFKMSPNCSSSCGKKKAKPNMSINKIVQPPSVSVSTANIISNVTSPKKVDIDITNVKSEPIDVFDFDDDSPPHSLPLAPLSLSSSNASTSLPATSFSSLITQPQSPIITASLPSLPSLLPSTPDPPAPVIEKPPACFFSLLRDVFGSHSSNDYKLTLHKLEELVKDRLRCYDPKIGWNHEMVQSAMNYLSGVLPPPAEIPLVDYKEKNQQWQWIGTGRDSDEVLVNLCKEWIEEKDRNNATSLMDPSQPIPPAICQTSWTVRSSSEEEKKSYRDQEAKRYNNPHKAFTFTVHGYTSVVGPVKGCGIGSSNSHSSSPNKAREHSLLVSDRPPFVTLLSLVRDAAARLPNGEGTRADICELLKDSQYLLPSVSDQQVNGIVSGALDRLHYEKDPCVKYDVNRKVWIYLHRNRSEEEFERLHEVQVAAAKAKRTLNKAQRRANSSSGQKCTSKQSTCKVSKVSSFSTSSNSECASNSSNLPKIVPSITLTTRCTTTITSITSPLNVTFTNTPTTIIDPTPKTSVTDSLLPSSSCLMSLGKKKAGKKKKEEQKEIETILPPTVKTVAFTSSLPPTVITAGPVSTLPQTQISNSLIQGSIKPTTSIISTSRGSVPTIQATTSQLQSIVKPTPSISNASTKAQPRIAYQTMAQLQSRMQTPVAAIKGSNPVQPHVSEPIRFQLQTPSQALHSLSQSQLQPLSQPAIQPQLNPQIQAQLRPNAQNQMQPVRVMLFRIISRGERFR